MSQDNHPPPGLDERSSDPRKSGKTARRAWLSSLALVLVPALLAIGAAAAASAWLLSTAGGLRAAFAIADLLTAESISAHGIEGSIARGFSIERLDVRAAAWTVDIASLVVEPIAVSWTERSVGFERLSAHRVNVRWPPGGGEPVPLPSSLALPLSLRVQALSIDELSVAAQGGKPLLLRQVELRGRTDQEHIRIERAAAAVGELRAELSGQIAVAPPFALRADGQLSSALLERGVEASVKAAGELARIDLDLALRATDASSAAERASLRAQLAPFAPVPVVSLDAELQNWEPARWFSTAPAMQLSGRARLAQLDTGAAFTLAGPFEASNSMAGPLDSGRIPASAARGTLRWSAGRLLLAIDEARGARGRASGQVELSGAALNQIDARARVDDVDLKSIHSKLASTALRGDLHFEQSAAGGRLRAQLANSRGLPLQVDADVALHADRVDIAPSTIRLGAGRARARGSIGLLGAVPVRLSAEFEQLDLAALVPGVATRLAGELAIDGVLQPTPHGTANLSLRDSQVLGRPASGKGSIVLKGETLAADLQLASRAASLQIKGGLGGAGELRELVARLDVPQLGELLDGVSGALDARITASGPLEAPQFKLSSSLTGLRMKSGLKVRTATVEAAGGLGNEDALALVARLSDLETAAGPDASFAQASLIGRGTTSSHTLELVGTTVAQQPVRVLVSGGWKTAASGAAAQAVPGTSAKAAPGAALTTGTTDAWRGSIVTAESGAPLELRLRDAPLMVSTSAFAFGPTSFELRGALFSEVEYRRNERNLQLRGAFSGLRPQALNVESRALQRVTRGRAATRVPLTLGGRWDIRAEGESITGVIAVERTAGDLYAGIDALRPVGITDVGLALSIVANRANGTAYMRGRDFGAVDATVDAVLERVGAFGIRVAPKQPIALTLDAGLGDLGWIGPLVSDNVEFGGAVKASMRIAGSIEDPVARGEMSGTALRLIWVEQGLRLDNGSLEAELEEGVLVLKDLHFSGAARTVPGDQRAAVDLDTSQPGQVRAFGRLALSTLTGSFGASADRLPVLQRRDRWMVVSGEGGITLTPRRAEVTAKLVADGAFLDLSGLARAATTSDDVIIKQRAEVTRPSDPPVDIVLNLRGELGRRFYMRGSGVDTRLAGAVDLKRVNGQFSAIGAVQAVGGVFSRYGQRLQIERGIVTFQGPPENPALNVLALRPGLPVEVGVSIAGTLARPVVRLHSDPPMSDAERLNWLVLGRPPASGADSQDRALLAATASAMLAGQTDSASAQLLRSLGFDDIGVRTGNDVGSLLPRETVAGRLRASTGSALPAEFISVGRRINEQLYLSFEQALSGAAYAVALSYQVTQRLSVVGRAGTQNALDLVYSFAFD